MQSVAYLTTAPMGGYKSYSRGVSFVLDVWLPDYQGVLYTTIPLVLDEIVAIAGRRGISESTVRNRVRVIPQELVASWIAEGSVAGPWDMLGKSVHPDLYEAPWIVEPKWDFKGAHIQLDEFHYYCPSDGESARRRRWKKFLSEIRHLGATIEFLTQDIGALDSKFSRMIALRRELVNQETSRDPFFHISMSDWYELKGKFIGYWSPCIIEIEKRRADRVWRNTGYVRKVYPRPDYYRCYNSWSKPHHEISKRSLPVSRSDDDQQLDDDEEDFSDEEEGSEARPNNPNPHQFERRSWPGLIFWFLRRNGFALVWRFAALMLVFWLCMGGGNKLFFGFCMSFTKLVAKKNGVQASSAPVSSGSQPSSGSSTGLPNYSRNVVPCLDLVTSAGIVSQLPGEPIQNFPVTTQTMLSLLAERRDVVAEKTKIQSELAASNGTAARIVMVGHFTAKGKDYVVFDTSDVYFVGDVISASVAGFKGKKISGIDLSRGFVFFDDDTRAYVVGVSRASGGLFSGVVSSSSKSSPITASNVGNFSPASSSSESHISSDHVSGRSVGSGGNSGGSVVESGQSSGGMGTTFPSSRGGAGTTGRSSSGSNNNFRNPPLQLRN